MYVYVGNRVVTNNKSIKKYAEQISLYLKWEKTSWKKIILNVH